MTEKSRSTPAGDNLSSALVDSLHPPQPFFALLRPDGPESWKNAQGKGIFVHVSRQILWSKLAYGWSEANSASPLMLKYAQKESWTVGLGGTSTGKAHRMTLVLLI